MHKLRHAVHMWEDAAPAPPFRHYGMAEKAELPNAPLAWWASSGNGDEEAPEEGEPPPAEPGANKQVDNPFSAW